MKTCTSLLVALGLGLAPALVSANNTTYYVSPGGSDSNDGLSWATAFATAAKGFSMANTSGGNTGNNGNTVIFAAGTYNLSAVIGCTGASYEDGRTRVMGATENPEDVVLRGPGNQEVLRLAVGVTVANMTIENGSNSGRDYRAAGVRVGAHTGAGESGKPICIVSNCIIRSCHNAYDSSKKINNATAYGGPVVVHNDGLLVDCVVSNNTAVYRGCGVTLGGAYAKALRCVITGNSASEDAGASVLGANNDFKMIGGGQLIDCIVSNNVAPLYAGALNVAVVSGCTFENNRSTKDNGDATSGGGLTVSACNATVSDCVFLGNEADYGAGADVRLGYSASFTNCLFEGNIARYGGGGVVVANGSNVSFNDCRFFGNQTMSGTAAKGGDEWGGGGIFLKGQNEDGWCSVSNSVFGGNSTNCRGGAFAHSWMARCQAEIVNCVFTNNVSMRQGGAIVVREDYANHDTKAALIRNCLIANNRTTLSSGDSNGAGIHLVTYNPVSVENCTIVSNVTAYTVSGGVHHRYCGQLVNCILAFNKHNSGAKDDAAAGETTVWSYAGGTYLNCCSYPTMTSHMTAGNGCINADPKFKDAVNGDFTLQRSSPCRNKGQARDWMAGAFDLSGAVARISESKPDIGCYEIPASFTHTILIFN